MDGESWRRVHGELTRLAAAQGQHDVEEARWLIAGKRVRVHEPLGFGSLLEYLERLFGYGPRLAREKLRVAEAMAALPALGQALAAGVLSWSAVREISRVAAPDTCNEWIAAARGRSVREVEEMVSGRRPGSRPTDPADPAAKRHVLRLEVSGDALAAFRDARQRIELDVGHTLDDDELVRMLAHHALGGPSEPGRAAYQVAMTVCEQCGHGTRDGAGRIFAVEAHEVDAARCDAQVLPRAVTHVGRGGAEEVRAGGRTEVESEEVESEGAESEEFESEQVESPEVESEQVESPEVESQQVESQQFAAPSGAPRGDRATHVGRDLAEQGAAVHAVDRAARAEEETAADRQAGEAGEARILSARREPPEYIPSTHVGRAAPAASQSIPPRIRREVWRRDHGRCRVPGCRAAKFLEVHHIVPRALAGPHEPGNLLVMCSAHHARVHGGELRLSGTAPDHLVFQRADGAPYGLEAGIHSSPRVCAPRSTPAGMGGLEADAIGALRRLGVAAGDARAAVAAAARTGPTDIETLLRAALGVLYRGVYGAHVSVIEA